MRRKLFTIVFVLAVTQLAFQSMADSPVGKELNPPGTKGSPMVVVPAGNFMMGINPDTDERYGDWDDEKPYQERYIDEFYIDKFETTNNEYNQCVKAKKCRKFKKEKYGDYRHCSWAHKGRGDHPISCVEWSDAKAYCEWAGKRLATEAEWEKAARGTDGRKFPWGNQEASCEYAIFNEKGTMSSADWGCETGKTWPPGSRPKGASPYGAMDMAGNVSEWVSDFYFEDYYRRGPKRNPQGPEKGTVHVNRGGGMNEYSFGIRTTYRNGHPIAFSYPGIRCAMTP